MKANEKKYTTSKIGDMLGVNYTTVNNWIKAGKLKAYQTPGGHRRVMEAELLDFLNRFDMPIPDELKDKNNLSILIVDDEEPFLRSFKRWFEKYTDYTIISTSNGMESLLIAAEEKPELIVMDILLPGMNGVELCRLLKTRPSTKNIRVMGISGKADKETRENMVGAGALCCIDKTEALPDIARRIDKFLGNAA